MSIGIITCSYGNYDTLHPLPEGHGFEEAVCVTDDKTLEVEGWKMVDVFLSCFLARILVCG